jgi:hypothetical protein
MPFIKENPQWWVCELMDGLKSHVNILGAHIICRDNKIISVKEESNTSHVNQAYNQHKKPKMPLLINTRLKQ